MLNGPSGPQRNQKNSRRAHIGLVNPTDKRPPVALRAAQSARTRFDSRQTRRRTQGSEQCRCAAPPCACARFARKKWRLPSLSATRLIKILPPEPALDQRLRFGSRRMAAHHARRFILRKIHSIGVHRALVNSSPPTRSAHTRGDSRAANYMISAIESNGCANRKSPPGSFPCNGSSRCGRPC